VANRSISLTDPLYEYLLDVSLREHPAMAALRAETYRMAERELQMSPDEAQLLGFLAKISGAKRALEIGVFTGFSALAVALALPEDGYLLACDVSHEWTAVGKPHWQAAGVAHKIDLRIGPALETLQQVASDPAQHSSFDFAFIDADKPNYDAYYELCLKLVRPGGLIGLDNTLWSGAVADPSKQDEQTNMFRTLNRKLHQDTRVDLTLIPVGDGLTMARKR
jgi:predicted O-methyltransferase YrrM